MIAVAVVVVMVVVMTEIEQVHQIADGRPVRRNIRVADNPRRDSADCRGCAVKPWEDASSPQ